MIAPRVYDSASPALRAAMDRLLRELSAAVRACTGDRTWPHQLLDLAAAVTWRCLRGEDHDALADAIAREIDA